MFGMNNDVCRDCDFTVAGQICPSCQGSFECDLAQGKDHCWCMELPAVLPVCAEAKCLCEYCLRRAIDKVQASTTNGGTP